MIDVLCVDDKELGFENLVFDSHGHIHNKLPIAKEIIPVLKNEGFVFCRRPSNIAKSKLLQRIYKHHVFKLYKKNFETYTMCSRGLVPPVGIALSPRNDRRSLTL